MEEFKNKCRLLDPKDVVCEGGTVDRNKTLLIGVTPAKPAKPNEDDPWKVFRGFCVTGDEVDEDGYVVDKDGQVGKHPSIVDATVKLLRDQSDYIPRAPRHKCHLFYLIGPFQRHEVRYAPT
eukprot:GHVO01014485.1.p1 GENE.GHVO01014485.1~~GHVO01014485.1.p1  ORF type:complete len:122 (-),score=14.11 GHVO01014485.1:405-770(-)